jgi:hypothetical protein
VSRVSAFVVSASVATLNKFPQNDLGVLAMDGLPSTLLLEWIDVLVGGHVLDLGMTR